MSTIASLANILKDGKSSARWAAAEDLGRTGAAEAVSPLKDALADENSSVRRAVVQALGKIGEAALPTLIDALQQGDDDMRWTVTRILGKLGDKRAIPPLIDALRSSVVNRAAGKALEIIGWIPDDGEAGTFFWIAKRDWERCVAIGAPALKPLTETVKNGEDDARWGAAHTLGRLGDTEAVPTLIHALADEDHRMRLAAAEALGMLGDSRAVPALKAALMDNNYRVHRAIGKAIEALDKE
jgi:HEAT repeat protein